MGIVINETQWEIFKPLVTSGDVLSIDRIIHESKQDNAMVTATLMYGQEQGWLVIHEKKREELVLADKRFSGELPERSLLPLIEEKGSITMRELSRMAKDNNIPMNEIIRWGSLRGWFTKNRNEISVAEKGYTAVNELDSDEKALKAASEKGSVFLDELEKERINISRVKELLKNRSSVAKIKQRTIRSAQVTDTGREILTGQIRVVKEQNMLSSEDITSGNWKNITLRPYDITLEAEKVYPAKIHPLQKIIQQSRRAFLEMGFTEIVSPQVESSFWDFDALFQPQDHPARDMQDTFYLANPSEALLPDKELVDRVRLTHENGWETGSMGWGYKWDVEKAKQLILRTHTTASTIRALGQDPSPPSKVFCVGKVFRNETISYKHLPEFFQVEGIIIDENANLSTLLGTLKDFYNKMGFEKVKFKPSFFPYTEPSVEVFVYMKSKDIWIELGGAGIFRPEVTEPFGCTVPVLAWGLGLERLAMQRHGIDDIRELYWNDLDKIREILLCR